MTKREMMIRMVVDGMLSAGQAPGAFTLIHIVNKSVHFVLARVSTVLARVNGINLVFVQRVHNVSPGSVEACMSCLTYYYR